MRQHADLLNYSDLRSRINDNLGIVTVIGIKDKGEDRKISIPSKNEVCEVTKRYTLGVWFLDTDMGDQIDQAIVDWLDRCWYR